LGVVSTRSSTYRQLVVRKSFAILLVVLTVLPFTAPFRTCGAGELPDVSTSAMIHTVAPVPASDDDAVSAVGVPRADEVSAAAEYLSSAAATLHVSQDSALSGALRDGLLAPPAVHPTSIAVLRV
jgi:hypothetical protein